MNYSSPESASLHSILWKGLIITTGSFELKEELDFPDLIEFKTLYVRYVFKSGAILLCSCSSKESSSPTAASISPIAKNSGHFLDLKTTNRPDITQRS
jgi:hypothetical protein